MQRCKVPSLPLALVVNALSASSLLRSTNARADDADDIIFSESSNKNCSLGSSESSLSCPF